MKLVWEAPYDYIVVVNSTTHPLTPDDLKKTVYMVMEPKIYEKRWLDYGRQPQLFKAIYDHTTYNNNEWHLSLTREQLLNQTEPIPKTMGTTISAILSNKYFDPGHKTRINFARVAQHELPWHSYGGNLFRWRNYRGSLPLYEKDAALLPYKYTFNQENHCISGYYTEKLIDGILAECLVFYSGPDNIERLVDPLAYVKLDFTDIQGSIAIMKTALAEDWHSKRLPHILKAKSRILTETGFFPRLYMTLVENK